MEVALQGILPVCGDEAKVQRADRAVTYTGHTNICILCPSAQIAACL